AHPHAAAVATGTAAALEAHGRLAAYFSGVVAPRGSRGAGALEAAARRWPQLQNRVLRGVDRAHLRPLPAVELAARAAARLARAAGGRRPSTYDALFVAHDAAVAALPWPRATDAVYAYEDGARRTFERAARLGLARIRDLPL